MNKFFCMIAVSVVCLCGSAHAVTESWHVSLTTTNDDGVSFDPPSGWQMVPDGAGGVACSYTVLTTNPLNGAYLVIQWFNAHGNQIYRALSVDDEDADQFTIIGLDKSHLVYNIDRSAPSTNGCVVVDKLGREIHVANSQTTLSRGVDWPNPQPLQNDKNGFFIIRYTGDGADAELVRFLYK